MFRPLSLVTMRQHERQIAQAAPLRFTRADELIDDDLRAVHEIAELRLPDREAVRLRGGEAVLESEHCFFRQQRVDDIEARLARAEIGERDVALGAVLAMPHGM